MYIVLRQKAIELRRQGQSYPDIEAALGVRRSTLSYWLSKLELSPAVQALILERKRSQVAKIQRLGSDAHRRAKQVRRNEAMRWCIDLLDSFELTNEVSALLLAMLYLEEGFKSRSAIGLGNSNEKILRMFVRLVRRTFKTDEKKFRCYLHLRADQDEQKEKAYWSAILSIPIEQFRKTQYDKRTLGKKTWVGYHGVCSVCYYDAEIEKKLEALQTQLTKKILRGS